MPPPTPPEVANTKKQSQSLDNERLPSRSGSERLHRGPNPEVSYEASDDLPKLRHRNKAMQEHINLAHGVFDQTYKQVHLAGQDHKVGMSGAAPSPLKRAKLEFEDFRTADGSSNILFGMHFEHAKSSTSASEQSNPAEGEHRGSRAQ